MTKLFFEVYSLMVNNPLLIVLTVVWLAVTVLAIAWINKNIS